MFLESSDLTFLTTFSSCSCYYFFVCIGAIKDGRDRDIDVLNQLERKRENTLNLCAQVFEDSYLSHQQSRKPSATTEPESPEREKAQSSWRKISNNAKLLKVSCF